MSVVISTESLSKRYRLGVINRRYLYRDMQSFIAKCLGRPDPNSEVDARVAHSKEGVIWALNDVSIEINDGDVVGVIGRNGSGKSTLLKILSRITTPTKGTARIHGRVASLLEVGTGFHPELTGRDNVYLNGSILGMPKEIIKAKFDEIVAFSGVEDFIDTPVKRYSSGMKVRLAFAVAAHLEPDILIVDEVLAVGDAEFQSKCLGKIGDAAKSGRTILFVSHNAAAVENLCNKGIVLHNGKLAFSGTQKQSIEYYASSLTSGAKELSERSDRKGSGEIRATHIEITNHSGENTNFIRPGENIHIKIRYKKSSDIKFPQLISGLTIKSNLDLPILNINSYVTGDSVGNTMAKDGSLICSIENINLLPGVYYIDTLISSQPKGAKIIDQIDRAHQFEIVHSDFYGSGKLPHIGVILNKAKWTTAL